MTLDNSKIQYVRTLAHASATTRERCISLFNLKKGYDIMLVNESSNTELFNKGAKNVILLINQEIKIYERILRWYRAAHQFARYEQFLELAESAAVEKQAGEILVETVNSAKSIDTDIISTYESLKEQWSSLSENKIQMKMYYAALDKQQALMKSMAEKTERLNKLIMPLFTKYKQLIMLSIQTMIGSEIALRTGELAIKRWQSDIYATFSDAEKIMFSMTSIQMSGIAIFAALFTLFNLYCKTQDKRIWEQSSDAYAAFRERIRTLFSRDDTNIPLE